MAVRLPHDQERCFWTTFIKVLTSKGLARKALAPLLGNLPEPWFNWMSTMPYPALQSMFDGLYPKGMQWYWRGDFVKELTNDAIETHLEQAATTPSELS